MIPTKEQIEEIACLEQRSLAWFRARLGCITGSQVYSIIKQSDAEKALHKAILLGIQEKESKVEFRTRLATLKGTKEYERIKKEGPLKETQEEFNDRINMLKEKVIESPFTDSTMSYIYSLSSERNLRDVFVKDDEFFNQYLRRTSFSSNAIRWGEETEAMARLQYSRLTEREVIEIGFYRHSQVDWYGDSPDGLVIDNVSGKPIGALEIKCPKSETWIRYRHEFNKGRDLYNQFVTKFMEEHPEIDADSFNDNMLPIEQRFDMVNAAILKRIKPEYYWQCQSHCECNNVDWCDFIFYDQMQKGEIGIIRINRNQNDINYMLERIEKVNAYIENEILK